MTGGRPLTNGRASSNWAEVRATWPKGFCASGRTSGRSSERVAYRIVEVGPRLRETQATALSGLSAAGWDIDWGSDLAEACADTRPVVIVGNEFLDTIPVHLVDVRAAALREAYVRAAPEAQAGEAVPAGTEPATASGLAQIWGEVSVETAAEIEILFGTLDPRRLETFTEDGILEVFPGLGDLLRQVAALMPSGSLVNVDYGEWFPGLVNAGRESGEPRWGLEDRRRRRRTDPGLFQASAGARPPRPGGEAGSDRRRRLRRARSARTQGGLRDHPLHHPGRLPTRRRSRGGTAGAAQGTRRNRFRPARGAPARSSGERTRPLEADRQATVLANLLDERDLGGAFKLMVQVRE